MIPLRLSEIAPIVEGTVWGGSDVVVTAPAVLDGRQVQPGGLFVAFPGEKVDGHDFAAQAGAAGAAAVLGSRPTTLPTVVVRDAGAALRSLARHVVATVRDGLTVVAVTGSQGKTSTKDLTAAILSAHGPTIATQGNFNNELGVPITLLRTESSTRFLMTEMGASHVGDIDRLTQLVAPDVSIVLNVGKAHLGGFGTREAIAETKSALVRGLAPGGTAILNADDPRVLAMRALTEGRTIAFGREGNADVRVVDVRLDLLGRPSFALCSGSETVHVTLPVVGAHQAMNAAAAAAAAMAVGIPLADAAAALAGASLSGGRLELRYLANGATLLDDTYNASPGSVQSSLDALVSVAGRRHIAVLGEILQLGDAQEAEHRAAGEYAALRCDIVVAVGEHAQAIAAGAGDLGLTVPDAAAAADWLQRHLRSGDVVLVKASRGARLEDVTQRLT